MAGLGRKVFTAGEILTAANVNGYLMDQSVMVFDDAATRDATLPTPSQGMVVILRDSNVLFKYTGAAWVEIDGFKTAGTAGNLLVSDGTSGLVYLPNAAAGEVLTATGSGVEFREPLSPFLLMGA
jgi:hypothetical protein